MTIYNPKSLKADEFINHEEILETLKYAEENKNNIELIDSILEKARPKKTADGYSLSRALPTERLPCFLPVIFLKRSKKCTGWQRKSSLPFTVTVS